MTPNILERLYERYYQEGFSFTNVTSSHWRSHGWHKVHRNRRGKFKLSGVGFGDFRPRSPLNYLRCLGELRELKKIGSSYKCEDELWRLGVQLAHRHNRIFSYDCMKQVLSLHRLLLLLDGRPLLPSLEKSGRFTSRGIRRVCVIGDGYGYLACLLKSVDPALQLTSVNLGRGLFFDVFYTLLSHPDAKVCLSDEHRASDVVTNDFLFLPAENYNMLRQMPQDLVFNIASMQEMNISVVQNYIDYIRPKHESERVLFYCCNRREKTLPAGEVVKFSDYGWREADKVYFDEACPWYQKFPSGILGRYLPFNGEILHRFVSLAPVTSAHVKELKQVDFK